MKLPFRILLLWVLAVASSYAAAQKVPLGAMAPGVGVSKPIQGKPLAGFEHGKVYVLEFWATWCGSCRPAMPHLDDLAGKYAGKAVEIYSVSDEDSSKVEAFLKRFPMRTNVLAGGTDLFTSFGIRLLPSTILINEEGRVAAFTKPESVTETVLNALLEGRKVDLPVADDKPAELDWDKEIVATSVGHILFRFSDSAGGGSRFVPGSGQITADGVVLPNLFTLANDISNSDLKWDASKEEVRYRVSVKAADGRDTTARAMLNDVLMRNFGLSAQWQDIEREVYVLRTKGPVTLTPSAGPSENGGARQGVLCGRMQRAKSLPNSCQAMRSARRCWMKPG